MSVVVAPRPYTQWNLLDYFIEQLAREGDGVCANRISKDRLYNALVNLVCEGVFGEILERASALRPIYPYVLTSYYLLFNKRDLERATRLYDRVSRGLRFYAPPVDENELESVSALETVVEAFSKLRSSDAERHRKALREHLELLVAVLERGRVLECEDLEEWGCLFRKLVAAELDPDLERSRERLVYVKKAVENKLAYLRGIDEEVAEGYNLILDTAYAPIYGFILGMVEKKLEELRNVHEELEELVHERNEVRKKIDKVKSFMRKLRIYFDPVEKVVNVFKSVLPIIGSLSASIILHFAVAVNVSMLLALIVLVTVLYLVTYLRLWFLDRKLKGVERKITALSNSKVESISKIIWSS